jgi:predicted site-specific integrase-resolvase
LIAFTIERIDQRMSNLRAAIYARVSTFDQEPENQLAELRRCTAEAHGGTIRVENAVPRGAVFVIELPCGPE